MFVSQAGAAPSLPSWLSGACLPHVWMPPERGCTSSGARTHGQSWAAYTGYGFCLFGPEPRSETSTWAWEAIRGSGAEVG